MFFDNSSTKLHVHYKLEEFLFSFLFSFFFLYTKDDIAFKFGGRKFSFVYLLKKFKKFKRFFFFFDIVSFRMSLFIFVYIFFWFDDQKLMIKFFIEIEYGSLKIINIIFICA